jgi:hypothetical protein
MRQRLNIHIDLVCRISTDHVLKYKATARMSVCPAIESQDVVFEYYYRVTGGDEAFDLTPGEYLRGTHNVIKLLLSESKVSEGVQELKPSK